MKLRALQAALLSGSLFLAACDPGSDSLAGIEGTGSPATVSGSVTSYGSIYVNGIHIDIGDADIRVNGVLAGEDDIELGMVVDVEAEQTGDDTWVAQQVRHARALRGRVSEVIETTELRKVLRVLGQILVVYDDALFDGVDFGSIEENSAIEVSGFVDAEGRLVASRVAATEAEAEPEVRGEVQSLDRDQARFALGELTVDYTDAIFEEGARDQLEEGLMVRVQGGTLDGDVLMAERVRFEAEESPADDARVSREGMIQSFHSSELFTVAGRTVDASGATIHGGEAGDLKSGVRVAVSGEFSGEVLQASEVRLLLPGLERIRARVDAIDSDSGELVILGTTYQSSRLTAFEDRLPNGNRMINLRAIRSGDYVEVHARSFSQGLLATRIKRLVNEEQVDLRGPVTDISIDAAVITVMNVEVDLNSLDPDLLTAFLGEVEMGDRVTVRGALTGSQGIEASELSFSGPPGSGEACPPALGDLCDDPPEPELDMSQLDGRPLRF